VKLVRNWVLTCYPISDLMKRETVSATKFKANCFAYLDEIEKHGVSITITRRGCPVAVLSPVKTTWRSPANILAGKVRRS
jgi:prevent-host-death family protein